MSSVDTDVWAGGQRMPPSERKGKRPQGCKGGLVGLRQRGGGGREGSHGEGATALPRAIAWGRGVDGVLG